MNVGFMYYYGFIPVMKGNVNQYHQTLYPTVGIPIGKGKAAKATAKKSAEEKTTDENKIIISEPNK